jgi:delta8-fatty-acid desaturase
MSLARFNLYRLSYVFLAKAAFQPKKARGGRWWWWLEITGLCVFFYWYSSVLAGIPTWGTRICYLLITNIIPSPLHVQVRFDSITLTRISNLATDRVITLFAKHS